MALASNYKIVSSITSKVFQNVKYICLQKLATDSTQLTSTGKSTPFNPKEQQKDVAGLSTSVYTTPSHDPNHETSPDPNSPSSIAEHENASPDPNSPSSIAEHENASPDPNSPSSVAEHENASPDPSSPSIAEYGNENSNTTTKETVASFPPDVNYSGDLNNLALQKGSQYNTHLTPTDKQKFVAGHLPQNIVDSFYSKPEANLNKVLPDVHDHKLLLMSVELGMIPESVQLLCSELTPCKPAAKIQKKVNYADTIKNLITNIEDQCKLLNGVCQNDYNKLFLIALELGSIPQGLQTFFNEHFFVNNSKPKENDILSKEFTQSTENIAAEEKFSVGVTSILSLHYGSVPRIFDEYLNMSNNVSDIIQRTTSQDPQHLHNEETQKRENFQNTPSTAQSLYEEDTSPVDKVSAKETHSDTFTNFYSNTADIIDYIGDENDVGPLESFPIKNNPITELSGDIIKANGVFGMNTSRRMMQAGDPNHEISPKMTNPAPTSPYSILTEENVGQPSPSIQPEETCKHCLLSAQHDPGVVKEVPIILSQPHIRKLTPPSTKFKKSSTDLAESKFKNVKKSVCEEVPHRSNIENKKLSLLIAELGLLSKHTIMYCTKLSSSPPITPPKMSAHKRQCKSSKKYSCYNLFMLMLESGILPIGTERDAITFMDIQDSKSRHHEKYCKSTKVTKDLNVNYTHKPEPMEIKQALIPWKSPPKALTVRAKEMSLVPVAVKPITVSISEFIKNDTEDFLQKEKRKDYLHVFEIPLHNEKSTEIISVEHDAYLSDPKNDNLCSEVYDMNSIAVPRDVQQDNVNNINNSKSGYLCNEAQISKSCTTTPAVRMEQSVSSCTSLTKNSDKLPITEPVLSIKQEITILNYSGTIDDIKSQTGPHISHVKVKDNQIQAHQPQETVCVSQIETVTLNNLKMLAGSEISNTSEYIHFASYIIENPEKEVQEKMEFKLSAKSDDITVPLKLNVTEKYSPIASPNQNAKEKELPIVSPNQNVKEKELPIVSPNKTVMLPVLDTNDTLSISCCVRKEKVKKFVVSPEHLSPILDTNDTLSVSCNLGKEKANNKPIVDSPEETVTSPVLDTNDTLSKFYNVRNEKVNNKTVVSPEKTVMPPILDNDTLSGSCNVGKEKTIMKFVVSSDQLTPKLDTDDTISCIVENDKAYNKTLVSPEKSVTVPALDMNDTLLCNLGKEKYNNQNLVVAPEQTVMSPVLDTKDTLSISCNVEKVKNLVSDENVESMSDKNIVSVFYANLCMNSKSLESSKCTHMTKQDTESSNKSLNAYECLNFTDKAQRSIEAIVKAVADKYNYSVKKLYANYISKSDNCPPTEVETYFHMGDIFKNIWKPFTLNIWKVYDYLNNIILHNGLTNLALKHDLPQKLESCDLEVTNKLNSAFLLTQIKEENVYRISKYKYFSELCPEPFAIYPKLKLKSNLKEDVKQHIEKCSTGVTGPSSSVFVECNGEVGPGASKSGEYKNPEYFSYHKESYFEAEVEMLKYRLPQPSSREK